MHFDADIALADGRRSQVEQAGSACTNQYDFVSQPFSGRGLVNNVSCRDEADALLWAATTNGTEKP